METKKNKIKAVIPVAIIAALFIISAFYSQKYGEEAKIFVERGGVFGMVAYIVIAVIATVAAPISAGPLIPIAANAWGVAITAALSILGWTIGSLVAFAIGRRYGLPLAQKFFSVRNLENMHKHIPQERIFWSVVLLRIMIPVDLLSYALGIFGVLGWRRYTLATIIGITPFAFIFAYLGTLPVSYQLFSIPAGILLIFIVYASGGKKFYQ